MGDLFTTIGMAIVAALMLIAYGILAYAWWLSSDRGYESWKRRQSSGSSRRPPL